MGKILDLKDRADAPVRLSRGARGRAAVRAGDPAESRRGGRATGPPGTRSRSTRGCWPRRRARRSAVPACTSGAAARRVSSRSLEDGEGEERRQFLSGRPCGQADDRGRGRRSRRRGSPSSSATLMALCSASARPKRTRSAGMVRRGPRSCSFRARHLPLADGLFQLSVALSRTDSARQFHRLDPALEFTVFPDTDHVAGFGSRANGRSSPLRAGWSGDELPHLPALA